MNSIQATAIGKRAGRTLAAGGSAHVIGTTSRGVFIVNSSGEVVFVSYESWHGPLTINLADSRLKNHFSKTSHPFNQVQPGEVVRVNAGQLVFSEAKIEIQTGHLEGWEAAPPARVERTGLRDRIKSVAEILVDPACFKGWAAQFSFWIDPMGTPALPELLRNIQTAITRIHSALERGDHEGLVTGIAQVLGKGEGLTPSGDDLTMGLLLISRRYPQLCFALAAEASARQAILQLAREKTTWLSVCLIESAVEGQADERLVKALDGVVSGDLTPVESAKLLKAYGSSSGGDAFLGMFLAIQ